MRKMLVVAVVFGGLGFARAEAQECLVRAAIVTELPAGGTINARLYVQRSAGCPLPTEPPVFTVYWCDGECHSAPYTVRPEDPTRVSVRVTSVGVWTIRGEYMIDPVYAEANYQQFPSPPKGSTQKSSPVYTKTKPRK